MDPYDYDEYGRPVTREKTTVVTTEDGKAGAAAAGAGVGVVAVIVAIVLAVAGWFWFNGKEDTPRSVANDVGTAAGAVVDKTKDAAAEVPQAAKDATTQGDQPTTRPNADGSTDKLDQKK